MTILLTLYLAGMPLALVTLIWAVWGLPEEDWSDVLSLAGLAALTVWVVLWPFFLALILFEQFLDQER
jgi:hypothetical protein